MATNVHIPQGGRSSKPEGPLLERSRAECSQAACPPKRRVMPRLLHEVPNREKREYPGDTSGPEPELWRALPHLTWQVKCIGVSKEVPFGHLTMPDRKSYRLNAIRYLRKFLEEKQEDGQQ